MEDRNRESALVANVLRFAEVLRGAGLDVHAGRMSDVVVAMERVGIRQRSDVRATLRCLLVHRHDDIPLFDDAFDRFWRAWSRHDPNGLALFSLGERPRIAAAPRGGTPVQFEPGSPDPSSAAKPLAAGAWSSAESLRLRDFAELTPGELMDAEALLARVPWRLGVRRTRRHARAAAGRIDLRPIVRANMKHGGELLELPRRERRDKPRPVVVLADVSGSMERYARMLLTFVYGMAAGPHDVESFVFATRLTRITREVARRGSAMALTALAHSVRDWGGGTRIGDALRSFNLHYARRAMRHGPVVLIISDGWDRGDPAQLAQELARVRRSCRRLVWLNPLLGSESYEPLTRGMRAALPFIDDFLPAHNLVSLEDLAEHLRSLRLGGGRAD
jgi:uncharacterized protein with von Willebrand factor type A (vWA) domain